MGTIAPGGPVEYRAPVAETAPRTRYCSRCLTTFTELFDRCPNLGCRAKQPRQGWGELLEPGDVLDRHYKVDKMLAIGGAGVTYLAHELGDDGQPRGDALAIKVLYAQRDQGAYLQRLANEANILLQLKHPHIVDIRGFVQRAGHSPYLVTRFEEGGSLLDHLRRVGRMELRVLARTGIQLANALEVAHQRGVIHRDLKPENILLASVPGEGQTPTVRLTDFGIAKVYGGVGSRLTRVGAFVGTPQYAAPEQFEGIAPTPAADVYAMGAVLLFCASLRPVLADIDPGDAAGTLERLHKSLPPSLDANFGPPQDVATFNAFLAATMAYEAGDRAEISEARRFLECLAEGRPAPLPKLPVDTFDVPMDEGPEPAHTHTSDTFEGLLSRDTKQEDKVRNRPPRVSPPEEGVDEGPTGLTEDASGTLDALQGVDEEADESVPEPTEAPKSKAPLLGALALLGLLGLGAAGGAVAMGLVEIPGVNLGAGPEAVVLAPDDPEHAALMKQLGELQPLLAECGSGTVRLTLTVQPSGELAVGDLAASSQELAVCVRDTLEQQSLSRVDQRLVKLGAELKL